jgi:hypothetical protein
MFPLTRSHFLTAAFFETTTTSARFLRITVFFGGRNMPDDKDKIGAPDRRMVSASEDYELRYFARRHNIPLAEARRLLKLHGNDRTKLEEAVAAEAK